MQELEEAREARKVRLGRFLRVPTNPMKGSQELLGANYRKRWGENQRLGLWSCLQAD